MADSGTYYPIVAYSCSMRTSKLYTKKTLANAYQVDYRTFKRWLEPIRKELGVYRSCFTPRQLQLIFEHLGPPPEDTQTSQI